MRDLFVTLAVFGSLPLILRKPFFGILVSVWLGLMNPHRLCWGFAVNMPFAFIVAVALILGFLMSKEPKQLPASPLTGLLAFWWIWMFVTTLTAFYPDPAWMQWDKVWRIMLLVFLTVILLTSRERIHALVWVCVISLGIYGVKGGIFTLSGGGENHVWGPVGSFISGNNEIGLALVMTIPLIRYLQLQSSVKVVKLALTASMVLSAVAVLGTQSRGALLGLAVMALYLSIKSRNRGGLLLVLLVGVAAAVWFMPESWQSRMETIQDYEQDASAMGRINAWWTAWYVALDHPIVGGGFSTFLRPTFLQYAPNPTRVLDVHSIYFQALGQHGFVGFFVFLAILVTTLRTLNTVMNFAKRDPRLDWMRDLAAMVFVAVIGYAISGAFLGLAYFDYYYTLVAITIGLQQQMHRYTVEGLPAAEPPPTAPAGRSADRRGGLSVRPQLGIWQVLMRWYNNL